MFSNQTYRWPSRAESETLVHRYNVHCPAETAGQIGETRRSDLRAEPALTAAYRCSSPLDRRGIRVCSFDPGTDSAWTGASARGEVWTRAAGQPKALRCVALHSFSRHR